VGRAEQHHGTMEVNRRGSIAGSVVVAALLSWVIR
jgi:hypothetical protein